MLNLTQEERKVMLFLVTIALIGVGSNFLIKQFSTAKSIACFSQDLARINLNSADKKLLMGISGIGEKIAGRIIEYRQKRAGFSNVDELKAIKGITDSKFAKIKEYLTVK
ncbi:MAG: helix-hairpin-helix domain-containing protein [Candidatus Omnitrophota bacterium]|jgi:competence ComEA-like helix-hairpin-helix protein|nr:helix-hairpin-helix domain-containing protein [Candidatus Omnitrophota bacterium]MDD5517938.1 helix-hairpin-helix domain-containing protein [Candidatus Omnitrophota bacterium]